MSPPPPATRPLVVLRHELPDGTHHFDLLIARDPLGRERLHSFRLGDPPDGLAVGSETRAERLFDHRPLYLTYEGPIAGNRGEVRRVLSGEATVQREDESRLELIVRWESLRQQQLRLEAIAGSPPFWRIVCLENPPE